MTRILKAAALAAVLVCPPWTGARAEPCGGAQDFLARLARDYGETPVASATSPRGTSRIVWTAASSGSWTMLVVSPDGTQACLVAAGEDFKLDDARLDRSGLGRGA